MQHRSALAVDFTNSRPVHEQQGDDIFVAPNRRVNQGCEAVAIGLVAVDIMLQKHAHDAVVPLLRSNMKC